MRCAVESAFAAPCLTGVNLLDQEQDRQHQEDGDGQRNPCALDKAGNDVGDKGDGRNCDCVGELCGNMVDVIPINSFNFFFCSMLRLAKRESKSSSLSLELPSSLDVVYLGLAL